MPPYFARCGLSTCARCFQLPDPRQAWRAKNVISPGGCRTLAYARNRRSNRVLSGEGECRTENSTQAHSAGDVLIFPAGVKHSLRNSGTVLLRQLCIFPADPRTHQLEAESAGQLVEIFNM